MIEKARAHIFIKGLVQGVSFRAYTKKKADFLDLKGWVRNTKDGGVEVILEGEKEKVEIMLKLLRRGPLLARVDNLDIEWREYKGEFKNFEIRYI